MERPVIVDLVRTASGRGKPGGALSELHPVSLLAVTLRALVERSGIDPALVDDVLVGCVGQSREQSNNLGRSAVLAAGFPEHVPAMTMDRQCGSSQQAYTFAAAGIMAGHYDVVIACGVESMSRVPMLSSTGGADTRGPEVRQRYPEGLVNQGIAAELIAAKWSLDRERLDAFAESSHERASRASAEGRFADEIVPVELPSGSIHDLDETIRPATTREGLASLQPAFRSEEAEERFPHLTWSITAGNSSPYTDGASAVLMMSESRAAQLGIRPRAAVVASAVVGSDPLYMLTGTIPATRKVLGRADLEMSDIDRYEVNEAFACVPLAWAADVEADLDRLNPSGGAIALGHPLGATGTRLLTTLVNGLEQTGGRYGLHVMCEGGGMANASVIERL